MSFARYKGEAENALLAAGFPHLYLLRPAYICSVEPRMEPNFTYRLLRAIYPAFRVVCTENLNPNVLTMKSAQYGARIYDAGSLNLARDRRIFVQ